MPHLHELLQAAIAFSVPAIELMALVVVGIGTVEAFAKGVAVAFRPAAQGCDRFSPIWLRYSRWLVGGLTFQLAADIIATSTAAGWEEVGKLGAIAVIRTLLNYFLDRDQREHMRATRESNEAAA